jgi:hypothetical protein
MAQDILWPGARWTSPPLTEPIQAAAMAPCRRLTADVAPPHTPPEKAVYGGSKNAPNTATLCHFSGAPARPPGAAAGSVSRCGITRSGPRWGRPGDPKAEWHRCTGSGHRAIDEEPPAGTCQRARRYPPIVLAEPRRKIAGQQSCPSCHGSSRLALSAVAGDARLLGVGRISPDEIEGRARPAESGAGGAAGKRETGPCSPFASSWPRVGEERR